MSRIPDSPGRVERERQNARAAQRAGMFEKFDRSKASRGQDRDLLLRHHLHDMYKKHGGRVLSELGNRFRPARGRILAKRIEKVASSVLLIPSIYRGRWKAHECAVYEVLAVGDAVLGIEAGMQIVASAHVGDDVGDVIGDDVLVLRGPDAHCEAEEHWSLDALADHECVCEGDVMCVLEPS